MTFSLPLPLSVPFPQGPIEQVLLSNVKSAASQKIIKYDCSEKTAVIKRKYCFFFFQFLMILSTY